MKSTSWLGVFAMGTLLMLSLAACQPSVSTPEPQQVDPTATLTPPALLPTTAVLATPDTDSAPTSEEGYPAPETAGSGATSVAVTGPAYPPPGESVPWEQATSLIKGGQVAQVIQLHSLKVILVLKDERVLETFGPTIDEVFKVIDECGEACRDIIVVTE